MSGRGVTVAVRVELDAGVTVRKPGVAGSEVEGTPVMAVTCPQAGRRIITNRNKQVKRKGLSVGIS